MELMFRIRSIGLLGALLFVGCASKAPDVSFRQPAADSGAVQVADFTHEGMPKNTDSLEVSSNTGTSLAVHRLSGGILIGEPSSRVLSVYTDYACEYCQKFSMDGREMIEDRFVREKSLAIQLLFVPRNEAGMLMAKIALCAERQGRFFAADRLLSIKPISSEKELPSFAEKAGIHLKTLRACIGEKKLASELSARGEMSSEMRVPTFVIGEETWVGLPENDDLERRIKKAMK